MVATDFAVIFKLVVLGLLIAGGVLLVVGIVALVWKLLSAGLRRAPVTLGIVIFLVLGVAFAVPVLFFVGTHESVEVRRTATVIEGVSSIQSTEASRPMHPDETLAAPDAIPAPAAPPAPPAPGGPILGGESFEESGRVAAEVSTAQRAPSGNVQLPPSVALVSSAGDDREAWMAANVLAEGAEQKPWILDAAGSRPFAATVHDWMLRWREPGPQGQIVGYSGLEPDGFSALHAARHSAVKSLSCMLIWQTRDVPRNSRLSPLNVASALAKFTQEIGVYVDQATVDKFQQEVPREYARLQRAAILVDARPERFGPLRARFEAEIRKVASDAADQRRQWLVTISSALGLALVVFLLYSFLNAGTKGHFAWPLRIVSLGALVLLYLGLMYVQGWFP